MCVVASGCRNSADTNLGTNRGAITVGPKLASGVQNRGFVGNGASRWGKQDDRQQRQCTGKMRTFITDSVALLGWNMVRRV